MYLRHSGTRVALRRVTFRSKLNLFSACGQLYAKITRSSNPKLGERGKELVGLTRLEYCNPVSRSSACNRFDAVRQYSSLDCADNNARHALVAWSNSSSQKLSVAWFP